MATIQGNIKDRSGNTIIPNTTTNAILDVEKEQALALTLLDKVDRESLGYNAFSTTTAYAVGDKVYHKGKLYKFTASKSAGNWDLSKVAETSVKELFGTDIIAEATARANADSAETTARTNADTALAAALAAEETARTNAFNDLDADRDFMLQSFGKYNSVGEVTLSKAIDNKYVSVAGVEVSNSGYAISNEFSLNMGDILLVPSASAVLADCSVVSQKVTRTYQKVITYTYTYNEDGSIHTATDTNRSLVYTYVYDEEGVLTDITLNGQSIGSLNIPTTYEVTENFYIPLVRQSVAAMPSAGYYVYLAPQNLTVVVSALKATIQGGVCKKVGWGIFKNIASNFVGALAQRAIAEAFVGLNDRIAAIESGLENGFGALKVQKLDILGTLNMQLRDGGTAKIVSTHAPDVAPAFVGQEWYDITNKVSYDSFGTSSVTDWKQRSNS